MIIKKKSIKISYDAQIDVFSVLRSKEGLLQAIEKFTRYIDKPNPYRHVFVASCNIDLST